MDGAHLVVIYSSCGPHSSCTLGGLSRTLVDYEGHSKVVYGVKSFISETRLIFKSEGK